MICMIFEDCFCPFFIHQPPVRIFLSHPNIGWTGCGKKECRGIASGVVCVMRSSENWPWVSWVERMFGLAINLGY